MEIDRNWIRDVCSKLENVNELLWIKYEPAVEKDENFASTVLKVTITTKLSSGGVKDIFVILKTQSGSGGAYKGSDEEYVFGVETKVFTEILKSIEDLVQKVDSDDILWPKFYGAKKMSLLLEDLGASGYKMIPKQNPLTVEQALLLMNEYGKFHALSMIQIERGQLNPDSIQTLFIAVKNSVTIRMYQSAMMTLADIIDQHWKSKWKNFCNEIRSDIGNIGRKLKDLALKTRSTFCVFNHGDCWTNNIMFKYSQEGKLLGIKLIDFQEAHFNCFAWDLTCLLYNSMLPSTRRACMNELLDCYRFSVEKTCKKYGYDGPLPSREQIHSAMDNMRYYGLLNAINARPLLIASTQENFIFELEKLHDDSPVLPQSVHNKNFYTEETINILHEEIQLYLDHKQCIDINTKLD